MSNIYISEPPTKGKVVLETTAGEIEIELWSKECPKACRNFVQLSLEGYYDNTQFHRVVPGWIVQGGDPTGTGTGGASIYNGPFADELHSRLRFTRRGLLAMANAGPNDNGSQFFFTLGAAPELQRKHTIFGTVVGDSLYNMLKLGEGEIDKETERPVYQRSIKHVRVLDNPFPDIVPRTLPKQSAEPEVKKSKSKIKVVKNKKLLSFDDGDDDEEEEFKPRVGSKMKSSHDLLTDDPMLSKSVAKVAKPKKTKTVEIAEPETKPEPTAAEPAAQPQPSEMQSQIQSVEAEIRKLQEREDKRKAISDEGEPETNPKKPKKHTNALSALLSQYKTSGPKKSKKDTKSREDELFARLGSFQSKIRSSKSKTAASQPATAGTAGKCTLHGVLDCQSCWRSQLDTDVDHLNEAGGSENWLTHSLAFKRNKERVETEYAPKVEDYVVIDPRDREASIKRRK